MGRAKQLLPFEGSTVLDRILDKVLRAGFAPVLLVVGGQNEEILRSAFSGRRVSIVPNLAPEPGGTITSIRCGLRALKPALKSYDIGAISEQSRKQNLEPHQTSAPGFLLHPSDFPAVSAETYDLLFDAIHAASGSIIVPICRVANGQGESPQDNGSGKGMGSQRRSGWRRGHPVWFPSSLLHAFMTPLPGGARELLRTYSDLVREIPVEDAGVHLNVDTPADYAQLSSFGY